MKSEIQTLLFALIALCCLARTSHAEIVYDVAIKFGDDVLDLEARDVCSDKEKKSIHKIVKTCIRQAGMPEVADSANWKEFDKTDRDDRALEVLQGGSDKDNRQMLGCSPFCQVMCQHGAFQYCWCCQCCGRLRRQLRAENVRELENNVAMIKNCVEALSDNEDMGCIAGLEPEVIVETE